MLIVIISPGNAKPSKKKKKKYIDKWQFIFPVNYAANDNKSITHSLFDLLTHCFFLFSVIIVVDAHSIKLGREMTHLDETPCFSQSFSASCTKNDHINF